MEKTTDNHHKQTTALINKLEVVHGMDTLIIVQQQQLVVLAMAAIRVHLLIARTLRVNKDINLIHDDDDTTCAQHITDLVIILKNITIQSILWVWLICSLSHM